MNGSLNPVAGRSPISELRRPDPGQRPRSDTSARFVSFHPTRGFFRPKMPVTLSIEVSPAAVATTSVELRVVDLDGPVVTKRIDVKRESQVIEIPLSAPAGSGFGLHGTLFEGRTHEPIDVAYSAADFQNSWVDAPRYAFLSQFGPDEGYEQRAHQLLERHVTSVQFYDWMYRHYRLLPPSDDFTDVLGRRLSLASVRSAISAVHNRGMAAIAYGSVYGAEAEYALEHPEELLYDESGKPITLADVFYLQDVRPGPWRDRILAEYRDAIRRLGFDGIHADQYGTETSGATAYDHKGRLVDLGPALAGIAGAAQEVVVEAGGDGIIFNCVTNWPIHETAKEEQLATYIEVWPPYTTLADLVALVCEAKALAPQRQVILAAYMSCAAEDPDAAEVATLLASSAIHAAGGFHLLLGEGTGILVHAYYPNFVRPGPHFQERLIEHWDFVVRYGRYLCDRSLTHAVASAVQADDLWCLRRTGTEFETLSLIHSDPGQAWDQVKSASPKRDVPLRLSPSGPVAAVYVASPGQPDAVRLPFQQQDDDLFFHVPELDLWSLVVMQYEK